MFNLRNLVRKNILDLQPYTSARSESTIKNAVFLDANENPYGTLNRYPDPHQQALKEKLGSIKNISPDHIFIGNGSDEIIDLIIRVFCNPGKDKVLAFSPSYGMYKVSAAVNGCGVIEIPLLSNFQIDFPLTIQALQNNEVKVLFVCSPNNPTGNIINNIDALLQHFNGIVVADEAYIDFAEEESLIEKINTRPNLIVIQTLSKSYGLAGARIGMAFAQPETISFLNKIKPPYNVSILNQQAAQDVLQQQETFQKNKKLITVQRKKMAGRLEMLPFVKQVFPSDANFLLIKTTSAAAVCKWLAAHNIIIRNRDADVQNSVRITIGTPEENDRLLTVLTSFIND